MLHNLVRAIVRLYPDKYEKRLYTARILIAFHALLRIGEYTVRGGVDNHVIQRNNIKFSFKDSKISGVDITLAHYKHSRGPITLAIRVSNKHAFCPALALYKYHGMGGPAQGPVFINRDGSPVSSYQFNKVFQQLVQDTFLDPRKYTPHSLRIGGATRAHQLNMSHSRIKEMGRWNSDSYKRYIRIPMSSC